MKPNISKGKSSRIALFGLALAILGEPVFAQQPSAPPVRYNITDLGTLGGGFSEAVSVNNRGLVSGASSLPDGTTHAVLWQNGHITDIGATGIGGPDSNSRAFDVNEPGQAAGAAETSTPDPNHEDFCGFGTHLTCPSFLWQNGAMTPLRTLGGNNNFAFAINNRGQVAGVSENNTHDASCLAPFQVRDFEAAIWGPGPGVIHELQPLGGDTVGEATWINDLGESGLFRFVREHFASSACRWPSRGTLAERSTRGPRQPRRDLHHALYKPRARAIRKYSFVHQQPRSSGGSFGSARRRNVSRFPLDQGDRYAGSPHPSWGRCKRGLGH